MSWFLGVCTLDYTSPLSFEILGMQKHNRIPVHSILARGTVFLYCRDMDNSIKLPRARHFADKCPSPGDCLDCAIGAAWAKNQAEELEAIHLAFDEHCATLAILDELAEVLALNPRGQS
jgi:hypothetical protein